MTGIGPSAARKPSRGFYGIGRVLVVGWLCIALAGCWPQPGYDAGRTRWNALEQTLTSDNADRLAVEWKTALDGDPRFRDTIAVGDSVFITWGLGKVSRLDARTGAVVWTRLLDAGESPIPPPLSTPVHFRGKLRVTWSCCRQGVSGTFWLDPATGADAAAPASAGPFAPAVAGGALAGVRVGDTGAPTTLTWGEIVLTDLPGAPGASATTFAIVGDSIQWAYGNFARGFTGPCRPSSDPYHFCTPDWATDLGARPGQPVAVGADAVAYPQGETTVSVLDVATGAVRWRADFDSQIGRPVVADGVLLVPTVDGVTALSTAGCGSEVCPPLWTVELGASSTLAAGGDVAYAAVADGPVVALALEGCGGPICDPIATVDVGGAVLLQEPVVAHGRVIVGNAAGELVALGLPD